jgi:Cof subfamily protein (haloacid dehalogenase superfamily)
MIRLIATDMDGSLLNDKKELPPDFDEVFWQLKEKGISLVAASGRSYPKQRELFSKYLDDLYFICDNGAIVLYRDEPIVTHPMDREGLFRILKICESIEHIEPILCGVHGAYHHPLSDEFEPYFSSYYINSVKMENLYDVSDDILKIAICDLNHPDQNSYPILNPLFGETYSVAVSGPYWMDMMAKQVNKGNALQVLQKKLSVSYEETMAFGDYYNDVELLQNAFYSFVMANANEDMKQYGRFVAESNEQNGVMKAIQKYVL